MKKAVRISLILTVFVLVQFCTTRIIAEQLQGRVYEGDPGVETSPLQGVTVTLFGAYANRWEFDLGWNGEYTLLSNGDLIETTTTDATGWYSLHPSGGTYAYYIIRASMPSGYNYTGARTVDGTVVLSNLIQFSVPLPGDTLTGNKFYMKKVGEWNHPPVARAGGHTTPSSVLQSISMDLLHPTRMPVIG